jgi:drug/metabolite transporter (DMT)-like permease
MPYFNPLYLTVAGLCDMTATSMMYVGLTMTYASTFQILRGFVVVVTAVFSQFVLKRRQHNFQWFGVAMVVCGTIIVGAAPYVPHPLGTKDPGGAADSGASNPALGNAIIVLAQIVVGVQMCWEEKYVTEYNIPALLVVGWEGFFGLFAIHVLITVVHQFHDFSVGTMIETVSAAEAAGSWSAPAGTGERGWGGGNADTVFWFGEDDAFAQFGAGAPNNPTLVIAMVCMVFSIAFFNFFGISVTKKMSAAHRMVLDSVRTCVVWSVGLVFFHEKFSILQLVGFLILIGGTLVYNAVVRLPCMDYHAYDSPAAGDPVLKAREAINDAITSRDFLQANQLQGELRQLGNSAYAQRGKVGMEAPLMHSVNS